MSNIFKQFWKGEFDEALTEKEIFEIQHKIKTLQDRGLPSSRIISALQKYNGKLIERWKAERAYWTEVKAMDTKIVIGAGDELGISKYKVIISPSACPICVKKTDNGRKIFTQKDIEKSNVPSFHPSCYCIIVPYS